MNTDKTEQYTAAFGHLSLQSAEALDYQLEIAGMGARAHAFVIDWHIRLLLALAWLVIAALSLYPLTELHALFKHKLSSVATFVLLVPAAVIYFFYHPVLEVAMAGRTPGKRMAGVRLVSLQGHTPGIGPLLLRNVFRLIDSLPGFYVVGLVSVALTSKQVRIGDLAAGLVLVYDSTVDPKTVEKIGALARHSRLDDDDQALLLDILARWKELTIDTRISLAQQFLDRIGHTIPNLNITKAKQDRALKQTLDSLSSARQTEVQP